MSCSPSHIADFGSFNNPMADLIRDLDETCGMCDGETYVEYPDAMKVWEEHRECKMQRRARFPTKVTRDTDPVEYDFCFTHQFELPAARVVCTGCGGKGLVPTEVGMAILKFLQRHAKD